MIPSLRADHVLLQVSALAFASANAASSPVDHFYHIPTSAGGGGIVPPPPRTPPEISQERLELQPWNFLNFQNNRVRPPLVTIARSKVDACFWAAYFGSFHAKAQQAKKSMFFPYFHEECLEWNLLWKFGLDVPPNSVLVTIFFWHSFRLALSCLSSSRRRVSFHTEDLQPGFAIRLADTGNHW